MTDKACCCDPTISTKKENDFWDMVEEGLIQPDHSVAIPIEEALK